MYTGLNDGRIIKFNDTSFTTVIRLGSPPYDNCGKNTCTMCISSLIPRHWDLMLENETSESSLFKLVLDYRVFFIQLICIF